MFKLTALGVGHGDATLLQFFEDDEPDEPGFTCLEANNVPRVRYPASHEDSVNVYGRKTTAQQTLSSLEVRPRG